MIGWHGIPHCHQSMQSAAGQRSVLGSYMHTCTCKLNVRLWQATHYLAVHAWSTANKEHVRAQGDSVFGELTENITAVIRYFNTQVEQARGFGGWDWSVEKVLDVIKGGPPCSMP